MRFPVRRILRASDSNRLTLLLVLVVTFIALYCATELNFKQLEYCARRGGAALHRKLRIDLLSFGRENSAGRG